uniref:Estradiol 17-beta-dehydrogenase n=1 Tax=Panagrellus redivivus TaxID=6233 RepID=A0A7E4UU27_PANRE
MTNFRLTDLTDALPSLDNVKSALTEVPKPLLIGAAATAVAPLAYLGARYLWELIPVSDLKNKVVFVTGCDTGFGRLLALKFAKDGIPVYAGCLRSETAQTLEAEAAGLPGTLKTIIVDVRSTESVNAAAEQIKNELQPGQVFWALVNNAGIAIFEGPDAWASLESYQTCFDINTMGIIRTVHAFSDLLKASKGRIVSISSMLGRVPLPGLTNYVTSKFAAEGYLDSVRRELHDFGIKVSILEPGFFRTQVIPLDRVRGEIDKSWSRLTPEQQADYGVEFKEQIFSDFAYFHNTSNPNVGWVVNDYYHAVTAKYPRLRYPSGWECLFALVPSTYLPTGLGDWVIRNLVGIRPPPLAKNSKAKGK